MTPAISQLAYIIPVSTNELAPTQCEVYGIPATVFVSYRHNWADISDTETLIGCEMIFDEPALAELRYRGHVSLKIGV
jgi:hypothetical protein